LDTVDRILTTINPAKPVLLVDADEVLLRFVERLEEYFLSQGFELRLSSFQIAGNTYDLESGGLVEPKKVGHLIASFFEACVDDVKPVHGAAEGLNALAEHYQITILSNVPTNCRVRREQSLARLGINYPVIANKGDKGPIVKLFDNATTKKTVFIDDLPPQHSSVSKLCPDSHRVHFVADKRLAGMIGPASDANIRIDEWPPLTSHLLSLLES